jgi:hypothetical protein
LRREWGQRIGGPLPAHEEAISNVDLDAVPDLDRLSNRAGLIGLVEDTVAESNVLLVI